MELEKRFELINELRDQYDEGDTAKFLEPDFIMALESFRLSDALFNCKDILCMVYRLRNIPSLGEIEGVLKEGINLSTFLRSNVPLSRRGESDEKRDWALFTTSRMILSVFWNHLNKSERLIIPLAVALSMDKSLNTSLPWIPDGKEHADRNPISLHTILEIVYYLGFSGSRDKIEAAMNSALTANPSPSTSLILRALNYLTYFKFNEHRDIEQSKRDQPRKSIDAGADPLYTLSAYFIVNEDDVRKPIIHFDTAFVDKAGVDGCLEIHKAGVSQSDIEPWINSGVSAKNAIAMYRRGEDPTVLDGIVPNGWISSWIDGSQ